VTLGNVATGLRLRDKVAVVFGAGGQVGARAAEEFARQGARLFLSGRTAANVKATADAVDSLERLGGFVELDALDETAVNEHLDDVVASAGRVDVVFNAIGPQPVEYGNATDTMTLRVDKFMVPISTRLHSCALSSPPKRSTTSSSTIRRSLGRRGPPAAQQHQHCDALRVIGGSVGRCRASPIAKNGYVVAGTSRLVRTTRRWPAPSAASLPTRGTGYAPRRPARCWRWRSAPA